MGILSALCVRDKSLPRLARAMEKMAGGGRARQYGGSSVIIVELFSHKNKREGASKVPDGDGRTQAGV